VSPFFRFALFSSFTITLSAQSGANVISVEELRNPLTGHSLRAIIAAKEHLKAGQHERGMQELREAMSDPAAMPYAISILGAEHLKGGHWTLLWVSWSRQFTCCPGRKSVPTLPTRFTLRKQPSAA
jgi:hypothetical protein